MAYQGKASPGQGGQGSFFQSLPRYAHALTWIGAAYAALIVTATITGMATLAELKYFLLIGLPLSIVLMAIGNISGWILYSRYANERRATSVEAPSSLPDIQEHIASMRRAEGKPSAR